MFIEHQRITIIVAFFLILSLAQTYVGSSLVEPRRTAKAAVIIQGEEQIVAKLVTSGNKPVLVNGSQAATGMTVLPKVTIEVPQGVFADVDLGMLGDVFFGPETKATLDFSKSSVAVKLIQGRVRLAVKKGTTGIVDTEQGRAGSTDPAQDSSLAVYLPPGANSPVVSQEVVSDAGTKTPADGQGCSQCSSLFGLCRRAALLIIGGVTAAVILPVALHRGENPSPASPNR